MPVYAVKTVTGSASSTGWVPFSQHETPFNVSFGVVVTGSTSAVTYRIEHTFDDIFDPSVTPTAFTHEDVSANSTNADGNYAFPIAAARLTVVSASSSNIVTATFRQAGY